MAKHKAGELEGVLLDTAVAYALGYQETTNSRLIAEAAIGEHFPVLVRTAQGRLGVIGLAAELRQNIEWAPSRQWQLGGPIIEGHQITLCGPDFMTSKKWEALMDPAASPADSTEVPRVVGEYTASGSTPLVAAMRCFVLSQLGEEVELPDAVRS